MKTPEILSPAGSYDALTAAVHNGCDAIYLGGQSYGARAYAKNFDIPTMTRGVAYAHKFGVQVYCTLNTLFKEKELKPLLAYVSDVIGAGIDALILQDVGVAKVIREAYPDISLHASTQMNCHSLEGVQCLEAMGFERVVLARELSISEIKYIADNTQVELEAFVHGALCYSYSGQCLMSSFLGGRSGNRGRCAQPCRLEYSNQGSSQHLLSPRDIETLSILPELLKAGIDSLKIEGRMKSPEYVGLITKLYKDYTNQVLTTGNSTLTAKDREQMLQIFNRGDFSTGYYKNHNGPEMMAFDNPKNHGLSVGHVSASNRHKVKIDSQLPLVKDDLLEIAGPKGWIAQTLEKDLHPSEWLTLTDEVAVGSEVRRIRSATLNASIRQSNALVPIKTIDLTASFVVGQHCQLTVSGLGKHITVTGHEVQVAQNRALTEKDILKQLKKIGDYPVEIKEIHLNIEGEGFMPVGQINQLRREALDAFLNIKVINEPVHVDVQWEKTQNKGSKHKNITVLLKKWYQFETVIQYDVKRLYLEYLNFNDEQLTQIKNHKKVVSGEVEIYIALPKIVRHEKETIIQEMVTSIPEWVDGYLVRSLDAYKRFNLKDKKVQWDYSMNLMNHFALDQVMALPGAEGYLVSLELTVGEIRDLDLSHGEAYVYGHVATMTSAQCVYKNLYGCDPKQGRVMTITDRKEALVPVATECRLCYNTLFNPVPLYLIDKIEVMQGWGYSNFQVAFLDEPEEVLHQVMKAVTGNGPNKPDQLFKLFTRGHYSNGVD